MNDLPQGVSTGNPMRVLFLHGLGVKPGGIKPNCLRARGCRVLEPALPHGDFEQSVRIAQSAFDEQVPDVLVGDCRGGSVALAIDSGNTPLVLIAPAWRKWGSVAVTKPTTWILHCEADTVIRVQDSRDLARRSNLPPAALRIVGRDHFMDDPGALDALVEAVFQAGRPSPDPLNESRAAAQSVRSVAQRALNESGFPSLRQVACEMHRDTIVLHGKVSSYHLKQLAQEIVQQLPQVQQVENRLDVLAQAQPSDAPVQSRALA
jgi:hypothetical protein